MTKVSPEQIDQILPQTQCGLCTYGGCMPYAEAIVYENANINLCPPGGVKTLLQLGELTGQDPTPHLYDMEQKAKPKMLAVIREAECIGCTKCIQACPVDAILGGPKLMHTVIAAECSGCELCVAPCPVDCIDMIAIPNEDVTETASEQYRQRYQAREDRLRKEKKAKTQTLSSGTLNIRKQYIQDAIARAKAKKI